MYRPSGITLELAQTLSYLNTQSTWTCDMDTQQCASVFNTPSCSEPESNTLPSHIHDSVRAAQLAPQSRLMR